MAFSTTGYSLNAIPIRTFAVGDLITFKMAAAPSALCYEDDWNDLARDETPELGSIIHPLRRMVIKRFREAKVLKYSYFFSRSLLSNGACPAPALRVPAVISISKFVAQPTTTTITALKFHRPPPTHTKLLNQFPIEPLYYASP